MFLIFVIQIKNTQRNDMSMLFFIICAMLKFVFNWSGKIEKSDNTIKARNSLFYGLNNEEAGNNKENTAIIFCGRNGSFVH